MKVAVIGSGISGLGAAWLLSRGHDVTLFEKEPRLGGHSHTVDAALPGGATPVDTGFIVYNTASYPNLIALFDHLGVPTAQTSMSFAVSCDGGGYEYSGSGLGGFFGQRRNLARRAHWMLAAEILRFFREARKILATGGDARESLGDWLAARRFSRDFIDRHIVPMGAAIWSTPAAQMLDFPVVSFVRFFANHGLLQASHKPIWRTVRGGSREYVARIRAALSGPVRTGYPVSKIFREGEGVRVETQGGAREWFDSCVLATHADDALALLGDAGGEETRLLGAFRYARNDAFLHTDAAFMPLRRRLWSSWNYIGGKDGAGLSVTYWMNSLQPLETSENLFVTLNPHRPISPYRILGQYVYHHPIFDGAAVAAQKSLWSLQGRRRVWFAGSYFGHGFHEDGLQAGLAAAEHLGGERRPWRVENESGRIHAPEAVWEAGHGVGRAMTLVSRIRSSLSSAAVSRANFGFGKTRKAHDSSVFSICKSEKSPGRENDADLQTTALASRIYTGTVIHKRLRPKPHALSYKVFSLLLDVDAIDALTAQSRLFSRNTFNFLSFYDRDHGPGDGAPVATHARAALTAGGFKTAGGQILLLCYPRVLGYVFNPLSVYYAFGAGGQLDALIYEVSNTFGERRSYVVAAGAARGAVHAQDCAKELFVSPFASRHGRYGFHVTTPAETVAVGVNVRDDQGPLIKTHFSGRALPFNDRTLARMLLAYPLMTLKVMGAIHFEAAKLWLKGVPLVRGPRAPRYSISTPPATRQDP